MVLNFRVNFWKSTERREDVVHMEQRVSTWCVQVLGGWEGRKRVKTDARTSWLWNIPDRSIRGLSVSLHHLQLSHKHVQRADSCQQISLNLGELWSTLSISDRQSLPCTVLRALCAELHLILI